MTQQSVPKQELSIFDSMCIIVGIIIGAGIYETAPLIAGCMGSGLATLAIWLTGGLLAMTGALCYAELAGAFPREGGDYVYQTQGLGRGVGFLFGWSQFLIIRPGDIAMTAFIFARYAEQLFPFEVSRVTYAMTVVAVLTGIHTLGIKEEKFIQNCLTVIKALGLVVVICAALLVSPKAQAHRGEPLTLKNLELAMILVMFSFGGWSDLGYLGAEIKQPQKNILRSLAGGVVFVTLIYVLVNVAFLWTLGFQGVAGSDAVAVDSLRRVFPETAGQVISVLICISMLGALNGLIFTGSRITYAIGQEHRVFRWLGSWNIGVGTPRGAIVMQGVISSVIILIAGSFINTILYTAPVVWLFYLATGISLFVLRRKRPELNRPYRLTGYPWTGLLYCGTCLFMLFSCLAYAIENCPLGLLTAVILLGVGIGVYKIQKIVMQ